MASALPRDLQAATVHPLQAAVVERIRANVGQWTANSTVSVLVAPIDRTTVVRDVWIAADAVPADADGTLLITVKAWDASEGAFDSLVLSFNAETRITVAGVSYLAVMEVETAENQWTLSAGDSIWVDKVNNSAAIDTNANLAVLLLTQVTELVGA